MFILTIALNYLKGRRKYFFKSTNILSLIGIVIGVFSLLVVSSVMNGFDKDMRSRVIGSKSEIRIQNKDYAPVSEYSTLIERVENIKGVKAVSPVCENELMLQDGSHISSTVCYGIDFDRQGEINDVFSKIIIGDPGRDDLLEDGLIIGLDLSLTLNVTVGEYLQISSPIATEPTPFGLLPRSKRFRVAGIFISGLPEFDRLYTYMSLENGQYFAGFENAISHLDVKAENRDHSRVIAGQISAELGDDYLIEDWSKFEANLFNAIKMEKTVIFFVLILMIILAAFNMIGNFIKLVYEKRSEIGVLKALGAQDRDIVKIFMLIGIVIGASGTLTGLILALGLLLAQQYWHFIIIPLAGFPLQILPVELRWIDFVIVPFLTIFICFITTIKPARKTTRIEPIKTIRN